MSRGPISHAQTSLCFHRLISRATISHAKKFLPAKSCFPRPNPGRPCQAMFSNAQVGRGLYCPSQPSLSPFKLSPTFGSSFCISLQQQLPDAAHPSIIPLAHSPPGCPPPSELVTRPERVAHCLRTESGTPLTHASPGGAPIIAIVITAIIRHPSPSP